MRGFFNEWKRFVSNEKYDSVTDKVYDLLFRKSPALGRWSIQDEPIYNFLSLLAANYESLRSLDTAHMFYTNLLGSTLEAQYCGSELQNKPYIRYLELIQETMRPPVWSYDLYPMRKYYKNNARVWGIMFKEFYEALEAASRMAMLTHRPFWAFCQSAEYITLYSSTTKDDSDEICRRENVNSCALPPLWNIFVTRHSRLLHTARRGFATGHIGSHPLGNGNTSVRSC